MTEHDITLLFFAFHFCMIGIRVLSGELTLSLGKNRTLILGLVNAICMLTLLSFSKSPHLFAFSFALLGFSFGVIYPTGLMIIAQSVYARNLNLANAIYITGWDLGCTIGPLATAPFVSSLGAVWALGVTALLPGVALVTVAWGHKLQWRKKV